MAAGKATVRFAANFEANLAEIAAFWVGQDAPQAYEDLLANLATAVIANLERHPRLGRKFFARSPLSIEGRDRVAALVKRFGAVDVREYLSGDYLVLYCVDTPSGTHKNEPAVHLLAIRHHRQLSFHFDGFWQANRGDVSG